jgi:hypothetical protein
MAASVADGQATEALLLLNGGPPGSLAPPSPSWQVRAVADNLGIPGGRNELLRQTTAEVVVFIDDDAVARTPRLFDSIAARFAADPQLAALSLRVELPGGSGSQRQHNPRLGRQGEARSGPVTSFLGGAVALRRAAVEQVGGYCDEFFLYHEETDLAWRLLDAGWGIEYAADLVLEHPPSPPTRHPDGIWRGARNRVWLARRRLPWPLLPIYLAVWTAIGLARTRSFAQLRAFAGGARAGFGPYPGPRQPLRWRTAWLMTRRGRPPLV